MKISNQEIFEFLKSQDYQTERNENGEYLMYFELDMPRILEDYYNWKVREISADFALINNNCRIYEQDNTTSMNCKHCGQGKYFHLK